MPPPSIEKWPKGDLLLSVSSAPVSDNHFTCIVTLLPCTSSLGFPGGPASKESACNAGDPGFDPWVGKIPWRREWLCTLVFLPRESHGQRSLRGYNLWDCKELDRTNWLILSFSPTLWDSYWCLSSILITCFHLKIRRMLANVSIVFWYWAPVFNLKVKQSTSEEGPLLPGSDTVVYHLLSVLRPGADCVRAVSGRQGTKGLSEAAKARNSAWVRGTCLVPLMLLLAGSQSKIFKVLFVCQVDPSKCMIQLVTLPFTVFFSNYLFIGSLAESYSHLLYLRIQVINKSLKIIFRKLFEKYW